MIEILAAVFLSPFIGTLAQDEKPLANITILKDQYPLITYREKEYVPYEMLKIMYVTIDCSSKQKTIMYQHIQSITNGKILNTQNEFKTYSVDYSEVCKAKEIQLNESS